MSYIQVTGIKNESIIMEVIDNFGQTRLCQNITSKYPLQVYDATAIYTNGMILACGGYVRTDGTDQCYIYEKEKGWSLLSKMNQERSDIASIPIGESKC